MQPKLRIALLNDHQLVVRGLHAMLADHDSLEVVELAVGVAPVGPVDIALFDTFANQQATGDRVAKLVENPDVAAVVIYSWNMHSELVSKSLKAGVQGYLSKSLDAIELADALMRVAKGDTVVSQTDVVSEGSGGRYPGETEGLSPREAEIVTLVTAGLSNQDIADRAYLSINTIKTYLRSAYRKMGVSTRTEAVLWGVDHHMLPGLGRVTLYEPQSA